MPWAWHLAQWCYDPVASRLAGQRRFRLPYPGQNWHDEWRYNGFLLKAMYAVLRANEIFSKGADNWDDGDRLFYRQMQEGLIRD